MISTVSDACVRTVLVASMSPVCLLGGGEAKISSRARSRPNAEPVMPQVTRADALSQASAEFPTAAVHAELSQARGDLAHGGL